MLVPLDCLKIGDQFVELDDTHEVKYTVEGPNLQGFINVVDEFGYEYHFRDAKIVRPVYELDIKI